MAFSIRNKKKHKLSFIFLLFLITLISFPHEAHAQIFFSEDWDTGTPASCWPCKSYPCTTSFDGWLSADYNSGWVTMPNCGRNSTQAHSGTYSYYQYRASGAPQTCDISHEFTTPYPTTIYIRFYLYLTTNWNSFGSLEYVHWIMTNIIATNTSFRLNFLGDGQYNCGDGGIHMIPEGDGGRSWWFGNSDWDVCGVNYKELIGAWHSIEYKMEISGSNIILTEWIDGVLRRGPTTGPGQDSANNFNKITISGWENTSSAHAGDFYIDDIVVSDSYIGSGSGDTQAPSVPAGLSAQAVSSSQINLSWTAATDNVGIAGYRIYRNNTEIATTPNTSYSDTGLSPSTNYTYNVSAYDAAGNNSAQSSSASATTQAEGGSGGNNSNGDTSASGGSGCGYIKGKRLKANGEGLSFAIMLVVILGGITMIRKLPINYVYNQLQTLRRHFIKHTIALFLIGAFLGFFPALSHAAIYYVSPSGTAQWTDCTNINTPCSASTAMANAVAGDIVYFRGGIYNVGTIGSQRDLANMRPANSGTSGNPITFIAYPGETPNITGTVNSSSTAAYFGCSYTDYITWDGFAATMQIYTNTETQTWGAWGSDYCILRNGNFTGVHQPYYNNTSLVRIEGSNYNLIENNYFHDLTAILGVSVNTAAVYLFDSNYTTVRNNTMENTYGGVFTKMATSYADIYNNFIYNATNSGFTGIQTASTAAGQNNGITVHNNIIIGYSVGIRVSPSVTVGTYFIYNNTIYSSNNSFEGIYLGGALTGAEVFNNIIANLSPSLRYYDGVVSYSNYNNFYRAAGNVWNRNYATDYTTLSSWTAATGFDANSITTDPLFVNTGGASPADYKLQASSPARTSGRGGSYATVMGAYITGNETIGYDPDAPRVEITSPPNSTVTTTNTSITISGTASDTQGIVSVTCNNSRGGNCTCTGTTNWTCSNIPLQSGQNIVTVTATDGDNKTGIDAITVTVSSDGGNTPPPSSGSGSDTSASGGSGCGFVKDDDKGQGAKSEGVASLILLIIALKIISVTLRRFERRRAL